MICSGRIVSIVVVEVTLLYDEHITSLLRSKKKDRRKARLQMAGNKFWLLYWFAVSPSRRVQVPCKILERTRLHTVAPFWIRLLTFGRQETNVAGWTIQTIPGTVPYKFRKLRVLHSKHNWPRIICGLWQKSLCVNTWPGTRLIIYVESCALMKTFYYFQNKAITQFNDSKGLVN